MLQQWLIIAAGCAFCGLNAQAKLCDYNVRVRNDISSLENMLRGCSVIAGNLEIALLESFKQDDYAGLSFPELTEIKGFFLMFRVYGLTTLSDLFPNLTIIRGLTLFKEYSFILFEVDDLTEIGLHNLKYILRGSSRIEKCHHLCYVHTVNWTAIGGLSHKLDHFNPDKDDCELCPDKCQGACWNRYHCQAYDNCHPECLGCTKPDAADKCITCRSYNDNGTCVSECPKTKFRHPLLASCMTKEECYNNYAHVTEWWTFQGECIKECPPHYIKYTNVYMRKHHLIDCKFCGNNCKACDGIEIDSKTESSVLYECTHISGPLSIRIDSKNEVDQLYAYLGTIEEIYGYLQIHRSAALTSLEFFKNLRVIHGEELYASKYALVVYENQNLYKLWNWGNNRTVEVKSGTIFFDENSKLCPSEIKKFVAKMNLEYLEQDFASMSNGNNRMCNYIELNITIVDLTSTNVTFVWENVTSTRNISEPIGYLISYIKNPLRNITIFDEHDDCLGNNWESVFITNNNTQQIINLVPSTQYAYYITLYSSFSSEDGHTTIKYFKTLSDEPMNFSVISTNSDSVMLFWEYPVFPNGHYELIVYLERDIESFIAQRNFCTHPQHEHQTKLPVTQSNIANSNLCCRKEILSRREQFEYSDNNLANHNKDAQTRGKRSLSPTDSVKIKEVSIQDPNITTYTVKPLKHFSMFIFILRACHSGTKPQCSTSVMTYQRTLPKEDADDIPPGLSAHVDNFKVVLKWFEPKEPNSLILSYHVQYKKTDLSRFNISTACITRRDFVQSGYEYEINNLLPGRYSVRVKAVSLAGSGKFSEYLDFEIDRVFAT